MSERRAFVVARGEGRSVWSLGARFTEKLGGDVVDGRLSLVEALAFRSTDRRFTSITVRTRPGTSSMAR